MPAPSSSSPVPAARHAPLSARKKRKRLLHAAFALCGLAALGGAFGLHWLLSPPPPYTPLSGRDPAQVALFALGDQGTGDLQQWRVALGMEHAAERNGGVDLVMLLGDNFYGPRLQNTLDRTWQLRFERVYWGKWLSHVPFYAVLGNHDFPQSAAVELAYAREARGSRRWHLSDYVYREDFGHVGERPLLRVVFLNSSAPRENRLQQAEYIRQAFAAPGPAPVWKVVAAHHPLRNYGEHGNDDELIGELLPVLQQSGVDLYLAGHDHNQQLIVRPGEPAWVISGGGGQKIDALGADAERETLFHLARPGFTGLQFSAGKLLLSYYDENGQAETRFVWNRDCPWLAKGCLVAEGSAPAQGH